MCDRGDQMGFTTPLQPFSIDGRRPGSYRHTMTCFRFVVCCCIAACAPATCACPCRTRCC